MHVNCGGRWPLSTGSTPHSASWPGHSCSSSPQDVSWSGTTVCSHLLHASICAFLLGRPLMLAPRSLSCSPRPSLHVASSMEPPFFPRHPRALPEWAHLPLAPEVGTLLFPILRGRVPPLCQALGQAFDVCSPRVLWATPEDRCIAFPFYRRSSRGSERSSGLPSGIEYSWDRGLDSFGSVQGVVLRGCPRTGPGQESGFGSFIRKSCFEHLLRVLH